MGIITIDGQSGVGKTARGIHLAQTLGYKFISCGYIFRTYAYSYMNNIDFNDSNFKFLWNDNQESRFEVYCKKKNITSELYGNPFIDDLCYRISKNEYVEKKCIETLKRMAFNGSFVIDGRNTNTMFDDIEISFILTCSEEERLKRIDLEMCLLGRDKEIHKEVKKLSEMRNTADEGLLSCHDNQVVYVDTTDFMPEETLSELLYFRKKVFKKEPVKVLILGEEIDVQNNSEMNIHTITEYKKIRPDNLKDYEIVIQVNNISSLSLENVYSDYVKPHLYNNHICIKDEYCIDLRDDRHITSIDKSNYSYRSREIVRLERNK